MEKERGSVRINRLLEVLTSYSWHAHSLSWPLEKGCPIHPHLRHSITIRILTGRSIHNSCEVYLSQPQLQQLQIGWLTWLTFDTIDLIVLVKVTQTRFYFSTGDLLIDILWIEEKRVFGVLYLYFKYPGIVTSTISRMRGRIWGGW